MTCRTCRGTGRVVDQIDHYRHVKTTCLDCYDPSAAQREEDESFARHKAAIREYYEGM